MTEASTPTPELPRRRSRIGIGARISSELRLQPPIIEGLKNLTDLPRDTGAIIAATHLSNIDMDTTVAVVAPYRDVAVASQSTHLEIPVLGGIMRWAGEHEIYGVSSRLTNKSPKYMFNPEDYEAMAQPVRKGKVMIIAAHKPTFDWKLPDRPGLGGVYLAQLTRTPIVPLAVDVQTPEYVELFNDPVGTAKRLIGRKRPDVRLVFGEPIQVDQLPQEDLSILARYLKHAARHAMSQDEVKRAKDALITLQKQGAEVMKSLAHMLPPNKRGPWQEG